MENRETEFLCFNELEVERKTQVFEVRNKDDFFLGTIHWRNGWRRYVFSWTCEPGDLDAKCMDEISQFIKDLMEARKSKS